MLFSPKSNIASTPPSERTPPKVVKKPKVVVPPTRTSPRFHKSPTPNILQQINGPTASTSFSEAPQTRNPSSNLHNKDKTTYSTPKNLAETQGSEQPEIPLDFHDWYDTRPDSPIPYTELISDASSDESDPGYIPSGEELEDKELNPKDFEEEWELDNEISEGEHEMVFEDLELADSSDDELREARQRVKQTTAQLQELAKKISEEASQVKFGSQSTPTATTTENNDNSGPLSEYEDSEDEIQTPVSSEDEDGLERRKKSRSQVVGLNTDWSSFKWNVGQRFTTRDAFKDAVAQYAIRQGRNLCFATSNKRRLQRMEAKCVPGCPFRVYGSWDKRRACFVVKSVDSEHSCNRTMVKNKQLKASWLGKQLLQIFKARPHWPAAEIKETVRRTFKVVIKPSLAYRVKYEAHKMLHGSMKEHYNKLGRYLQAIKDASPNSHIDLLSHLRKMVYLFFKGFFFCFEGLKKGWIEGCRRLLCIDACFIKTFLGGQLMSAIGRDANEQMYPVAWAVVEGENNCSWAWFFSHLQQYLELGDGSGLTIISDEHQALVGSVKKVLPEAEHRHCARHIFAHWHKSFKGEDFKLKFWTTAKSYNEPDFTDAMVELGKDSTAAVERFKGYNPNFFCRAFLKKQTKVDVIVNNLAETFNGSIIKSRTKHLFYMLEEIRSNLMQRLVLKKIEMQKRNHLICARVKAKLEKEKELAAVCDCMPSTATKFQVGCYMDTLNVDIETRSCTCGKWDLTGIPCCHAIACIFFSGHEAEDYVHEFYEVETYLKSYSVSIPPIQGERHWPKVEAPLDPPPIKVGPGRPRRNRIKDPFENPKKPGRLTKHGVQMSCSLCHSTSHNKRRCSEKGKAVDTTELAPQRQKKKKTTSATPNVPMSQESFQASTSHHAATAQPTRTGRGGRMIRGGVGSRGGTRGGGGRTGRGDEGLFGRGDVGRSSRGDGAMSDRGGGGRTGIGGGGRLGRGRGRIPSAPVGVGVLVDANGSTFVNNLGQTGGPRYVTQSVVSTGSIPLRSQASSGNV